MTFDPFWWKFFVMVVAIGGFGVLSIYIGLMSQRFEWWPFRLDGKDPAPIPLEGPRSNDADAPYAEPIPLAESAPTPAASSTAATPAPTMPVTETTPEASTQPKPPATKA